VPLVSCPKCATNLKIPEGASGNVKCPKCAAIFPVAAKPAAAPAFEVVEDVPAPTPRRTAKPEVLEPDFDVVEDPKPRKKVVEADLDDDDRPRSKRRRDSDDEEDDDRPRRKKGRRRDYDEEDDWQPAGKSGVGAAKVGMLMIVISLWLYFGTFVLLGLLLLIAWLGASIPNGLLIVPGLLGLTNWVVALIGLGFCIAGPSKARGLAIATTAVAAVHLVMSFVVANDSTSSLFGSHSIQAASEYNKSDRFFRLAKAAAKNPDGPEAKELREEFKDRRGDRGDELIGLGIAVQMMGSQAKGDDRVDLDRLIKEKNAESKMRWVDLGTLLPYSDKLIGILAYNSRFFEDYILSFLSGLLEVARLILLVLTVGAVARSIKAHDAAGRAQVGLIAAAIACGVALIIGLLVAVMMDNHASDLVKKMKDPPANASRSEETNPMKEIMGPPKNYMAVGDLLLFGLHGGALIVPVLAAHGAYSAAARRAR
jgi:LSD1 subclass zinc finger protein